MVSLFLAGRMHVLAFTQQLLQLPTVDTPGQNLWFIHAPYAYVPCHVGPGTNMLLLLQSPLTLIPLRTVHKYSKEALAASQLWKRLIC